MGAALGKDDIDTCSQAELLQGDEEQEQATAVCE